jgi:hypothetical protein
VWAGVVQQRVLLDARTSLRPTAHGGPRARTSVRRLSWAGPRARGERREIDSIARMPLVCG